MRNLSRIQLKEMIMSEMARELIQQALDQDYNNANKTFGNIMQVKLADTLDQEKVRLADQIYNGVDPDEENEEEIETDDEQLDLDLQGEEEEIEDEEESGEDVELEMDYEDDSESDYEEDGDD